MKSNVKVYIILLVLLFGAIIASDTGQPQQIDWRPTYSVSDKIPLGLYILDQEIDEALGRPVTRFSETPYEYLDPMFDYDSLVYDYSIKGTLMAISQTNEIDDESIQELLYFVQRNNAAFLSTKAFSRKLLDSLQISTRYDASLSDSVANVFADRKLRHKPFYLFEDASGTYFSKIDTSRTTILGYHKGDSLRANFIRVRYGTGNFYLHTQPAVFTNFHLLKGNHHEYAEGVLSYLPDGEVYWYTKQNVEGISASPLRYIFSQPALAWAWYLFLGGMLVFMLFNAKRRQRVVPVVEPLRNTTVDFARTIGNLYLQEGDHDAIINKKIIFFLEKIRMEYLIDTTNLDDTFIRKLHQKSGKDLADIKRAVYLINLHRGSRHGSVEGDLVTINNAIEKILH